MYYKLTLLTPNIDVEYDTWVLRLPTEIGRNPEHGVFVDHESVSRTHCRLLLNGQGTLVIKDLDSTNGTYVRDHQAELFPGDIIQIGALCFRVEYESDTDHGRPAARPDTFDLSETVRMRQLKKESSLPTNPPAEKKWWVDPVAIRVER